MQGFARQATYDRLKQIIISSKSEFVYLRGRRRVGKSWILRRFAESDEFRGQVFLFTGQADASTKQTLDNLRREWSQFSQTMDLMQLARPYIYWQNIFETMQRFAEAKKKRITLVFDEIQWIAKKGNGFIGALKVAWVPWQMSNWISVIVCGSSNRFFNDNVGGEEKILRGLQTKATIWVPQLSYKTIRASFVPKWQTREAALLYMMLGGVPYYLERIDPKLPFIRAINDGLFTQSSNLLSEFDELLSLEFNKLGRTNVVKILQVLGQQGSSQKNIVHKTGLSKATVSKLVEQLLNYKIIFKKEPFLRKARENEDLYRYYMKDFFLNFYIELLQPRSQEIMTNLNGLLFPHATRLSEVGYYIPNFSGSAFELFVRQNLESADEIASQLFAKLHITDLNYTVHDYWDTDVQVDLIIQHHVDRIIRIIDCKWSNNWQQSWIDELRAKKLALPDGATRKNYLIVSFLPTEDIVTQAAKQDVTVVSLEDFV